MVEVLCDLDYIEAKCAASKIGELIVDTIGRCAHIRTMRTMRDDERDAEMARWRRKIIEYAAKCKLPRVRIRR